MSSDVDGLGWTKRTTNDAIKLIRSLFKFGVDNNYIVSNAATNLKAFRDSKITQADYFSDEQLELIWKDIDPHWREALQFICYTGLRKGELINLQPENVNLSKGQETITIESRDDWETKTGKFRIVPLTPNAVTIIKNQLSKNTEYVFTDKKGNKIHPDRIYHSLKITLSRLGLHGDVHKCRHTFASNLVMKGVDLFTVGQLLGHTDIKTTQIYTHLAPQHLKDAVDKLSVAVQQK
jgi:integrase